MLQKIAKGLVVVAFVVGVICCFSGVPAQAQTTNCTAPWYCGWYSLWGGGCIPTPPVGAFNCQPIWWWVNVCTYFTPNCAPADAKTETCATCGNGGAKGKPGGGRPISLVSGNTSIIETDVRLPGLAGGLTLERQWNSMWPSSQSSRQVGLFGPNWRSTYEERIFVGSDNYIKYSRSDGSFWSFAYAGSAYAPVAPGNVAATLTVDSNYTYWTLTFQDGEQRIFNYASGWLTAIIDRNGNTTQLTYDALNRLVTVTDPAGRHLYFSYPNDSSYLVSGVTSDVGISLSYAYDNQGRLIEVTKPDQTTLSFEYDANSMITAVKDSDGKILESHTYDSEGRGLTSSRASGAEAITVTYPNP